MSKYQAEQLGTDNTIVYTPYWALDMNYLHAS